MKMKDIILIIITIGGLVIGILGYMYGQGVWDKPSIVIRSGSIDLKIPDKIQSNYFAFRMLFMGEQMVKSIFENLEKNLKDLDFPEDKLKRLKQAIDNNLKNKDIALPIKMEDLAQKLNLKPNEERTLIIAMMNLKTLGAAFRKGFLPSRVLIFRISNTGRKDAEEVDVKIQFNGGYMDSEIHSDNKIIKSIQTENNNYEITLDKLSPDGYVNGYLWYDSESGNSSNKNNVVVIYKNGKKAIEFKEGEIESIMPK